MNINLNPNMVGFKVRRRQFGVWSLVTLLFFGAVFASSGLYALNAAKVDPSWARVPGEVVDSASHTSDGSTTYTPVVRYSVNGQTYRVSGSLSSSSNPQNGEKREVAYNPAHPNQAKVIESGGKQWFLYLFPIIGVACFALALVAFVRSSRRSRTIHRLMQSGQKLQGILVDVHPESNKGGYKIIVSAPDNSGTVQNYVSDPLNGVGGLNLADFRNNPIPIDVYIDPANPRNYYVDVSDIPNLTPERINELIEAAKRDNPTIPPKL